MQEQKISNIAKRFRLISQELKELREELEKDKDGRELIDKNMDEIQFEFCKFAKMIIPNIHQKIGEIIEKSNHLENENLIVSKVQHGADLIDKKTGALIEIKESIIFAKTKNKCNFMWNIPRGSLENRNILIESIKGKTGNGGYAKLIIKNHLAVIIKEYIFNGNFLIEYFTTIPLNPKTSKINMGCQQCSFCKSFHKLDLLLECQKQFQNLINKNNPDNNDPFGLNQFFKTKISSSCKKK